jgi:hypothetical protein
VRPEDQKIIAERKENVERRLDRHTWKETGRPVLEGGAVRYEMAGRDRAIGYGGIGAMHQMVRKLKLDEEINRAIPVLKTHVPYWESDHVLNIAYNVLTGGRCLEDIERLRQDEAYMDSLGAERIPDPTTAGDFTRRLNEASARRLEDGINAARVKVWKLQGPAFFERAVIDGDGSYAPTLGECKEGMDISYNGLWGYHPLLMALANTREVLSIVNRPGNASSSRGAAEHFDRAIELTRGAGFRSILLRGDTDFSQSAHLDRWDGDGVEFIFGFDAGVALVEGAGALEKKQWKRLKRQKKYEVKTQERARPENVKERIVREREFKNIRLVCEHIGEFEWQPVACRKSYRMVVVRKNLSVEKGENVLFEDVRYFFYITNDRRTPAAEIVRSANQRCDQENVIEQLKNGVRALRAPVGDLESNGAYMVMTALAWNLKAWWAMMIPEPEARHGALRMEFKKFLQRFMMIPCQIVKTGRRVLHRILGWNPWMGIFLRTFDRIATLRVT